jgi:hypothetical protein
VSYTNATAPSEEASSAATNTLKLTAADASTQEEPTAAEAAAAAAAASLKCDDCGMLLKDEDVATLHAHKTGHINFSESTESIKPKTKEEIEEQKKRLQEKLIKIRLEKSEKEKQDFIEAEKDRRRTGREIHDLKQKHAENELKRLGEEKRREKKADALYKQNLLDGIARDKEAKKKAREAEQSGVTAATSAAAPVIIAAPALSEKKEYTECKIQVRQTNGASMVHIFKASEQLAAVRLWVEMNRTDSSDKFQLMQTFPKKIFTDEEMFRSLSDLGLTPASSLVISKV